MEQVTTRAKALEDKINAVENFIGLNSKTDGEQKEALQEPSLASFANLYSDYNNGELKAELLALRAGLNLLLEQKNILLKQGASGNAGGGGPAGGLPAKLAMKLGEFCVSKEIKVPEIQDVSSSRNALKNLILPHLLSKTRLIIDEIQLLDSPSVEFLIEQADQLRNRFDSKSLILLGTPPCGNGPSITLPDHSSGRVFPFFVPTFSAIEVYAVLSKVLGRPPNFINVFFPLWSCFDGVIGLYREAYESKIFDADNIHLESLRSFTGSSGNLLTPDEQLLVNNIPAKGQSKRSIHNQPLLNSLIKRGVLECAGSGDNSIVLVADYVIRSSLHCLNSCLTRQQAFQFLSGPGVESLLASVWMEAVKYLRIENMEKVRLFFGDCDIDMVCCSPDCNHYALFSCKKDPSQHRDIRFLKNIEYHLGSRKPPKLTLVLVSPAEVSTEIRNHVLAKAKFSWKVDTSVLVLNLAELVTSRYSDSSYGLFFPQPSNWQHIKRSVDDSLGKLSNKVILVSGFRRVGKSSLVRSVCGGGAIYVSMKDL